MNLAKLAPVLAALLLAACASRPSPTVAVHLPHSRPAGPVQGVDLPTDASDVLHELKDNRVAFVARYYREPSSRWPALSAAEAWRLSRSGIKIVAVWEPLYPDPAHFSYWSGYVDALAAYRQAKAVGQPPGSAIYFAIDFDARGRALPAIDRYFRGIAAGLAAAGRGTPEFRIGVYGSGAVCAAVKQAGLARYAWLSNSRAWAGVLGYRDWNIRQGGRLASLSFNHDSDEARAEYGGFRVATDGGTASRPGADRQAGRTAEPQEGLMAALAPAP